MLDAGTFENNLADLFTTAPAERQDAARSWADAYLHYVRQAQAGPCFRSTATDVASRLALETTLVSMFARTYPDRSAKDAALDFQSAFLAFWLSPPQLFLPAPATVGILSIVPPTLAGLLLPVLKSNSMLTGETGSRTAASRFASIIDGWTRTIIVAVTVTPPGTPVPTPLT